MMMISLWLGEAGWIHSPHLPHPLRYGTQTAPVSGVSITVLGAFDPNFPPAYLNAFPPGQYGRFACTTFVINLASVCNPYTSTYVPAPR